MKTTSLAFGLAALLLTQNAAAQVCQEDDVQTALQYLRRLSLDLRGRLPDVAEMESVVTNGSIDPSIVRNMVQSEEAIRQLRMHHRDFLWTNLSDIRLANQAWTLQRTRNAQNQVTDIYFVSGNARANAYRGGAPGGCLDEPARFGANGEILTTQDPNNANYRREGWVMVTPYWNPAIQVKVCAFDAQTPETVTVNNRMINCSQQVNAACGCGPNLNWCQSGPDRTVQTIDNALAEQLLRYIDKVIREGRPYTDVIRGMDMEVNGPISHYFRYMTGGGTNFVFVTPNQNFTMPSIPFSEVDTWRTVNRGERHAGILTMPGYLLKFQSNRGRANRFYNAFLCQYFEAPAGGLPASSDDCHNEPDLTKRCGCRYCHTSVEPAAAHWGRWAEAGVAPMNVAQFPEINPNCATQAGARTAACRRFYLTAAGHPDEQPYVGHLLSYVFADAERIANIDEGPIAIANDAIGSGAFASCAVKKIYERLLARETDEADAEALAELTQNFSQNYDYRALVEAIVSRPEYVRAGLFTGRED